MKKMKNHILTIQKSFLVLIKNFGKIENKFFKNIFEKAFISTFKKSFIPKNKIKEILG